MDEKSLFTKFWTDESKTTLRVLARIPVGLTTVQIRSRVPQRRSLGR
jgi:hypothetical protein